MARRLSFSDPSNQTTLTGVPKALPCIGLRGLIPPAAPSADLIDGEISIGESNLRMVSCGSKSLRAQSPAEHLHMFLDEKKNLRFPPFQCPELTELPSHEQRSAEFSLPKSSAKDSPAAKTFREFEPLFSRDAEGNPVATALSSVQPALVDMDWHPTLPKMALAFGNDCVYHFNVHEHKWDPLFLRHSLQKGIGALRFDPVSGSVLSVLASNGVCLWKMVQGHQASWMMLLRPTEWQYPLQGLNDQQLSFSPCGRFIAFCNPEQSSIAVWDLSKGPSGCTSIPTQAHRVSSVVWSPNGQYLLATSDASARFMAWDTATWRISNWTLPSSPAQQIVLHSEENILLTSERNCSVVSSVRLEPVESEISLDVGPDDADDPLGGLGGSVGRMCWSPTSERLAISFAGDNEGCELVALLSTYTASGDMPKFAPIGYIRGPPSRIAATLNRPIHMRFRPQFESGALLAIAWSQGQVTFYPLLFPHLGRSA